MQPPDVVLDALLSGRFFAVAVLVCTLLAPNLGNINKAIRRGLSSKAAVDFPAIWVERRYRSMKTSKDANALLLMIAAIAVVCSPLFALYMFPEQERIAAFMFLGLVLIIYSAGLAWLARGAWRWWVIRRARRRWGRYK